jgi:signal transduction histidine kinase
MAREISMPLEAVQRLQQIAALHDLLVRVLGHELRTPLSSVVYAARMINHHPADLHGTRRRADQIEHIARKLDRLIEHVLAFVQTSIEGTIPLALEPSNLEDDARRLLADLDPEAAARVTLECDGDTAGNWDHRRLGHVLANLVANALEHGEAAGRVRLHLDGREPSSVKFAVHNDGVIPNGTFEVLFEPFKARSRLSTGVGLGLYITERIVQAHGGTIAVHSTPEDGTEFRVELPRTRST